jgi:hypothetical protein
MIKSILVLAFFFAVVASLKPMPSVKELSVGVNHYCKDVCK